MHSEGTVRIVPQGQNMMLVLYCDIYFQHHHPISHYFHVPLHSLIPLHLLSTDVHFSWMNSSKSPFFVFTPSLSTAWLCSSSSPLSFPQQWCVTEIMMAVTLHPSTHTQTHTYVWKCCSTPTNIHACTHTCCWLCCVFALQANGHSFLHIEHETAVSLLKSFQRTVDLTVLRDSSTR